MSETKQQHQSTEVFRRGAWSVRSIDHFANFYVLSSGFSGSSWCCLLWMPPRGELYIGI